MNKNLPLIIAAFLGLLAVGLIYGYLQHMKKEIHKGMDMVPVIVASKDIAKGEALSGSNVASRPYPEKYIGDRAIKVSQGAVVVGARAKYNLEKGRPVLWSDIEQVDRIEEGIASLLDKDTRAVTIPVTDITGVGNALKPNNRVDVTFVFDLNLFAEHKSESADVPIVPEGVDDIRKYLMMEMKSKSSSSKGAVVLLRNVLVLATGKSAPVGGILPNVQTTDKDPYSSVTLKVTERQAGLLAYCLETGKLTLCLKNSKFPEVSAPKDIVSAQSLMKYLAEENKIADEENAKTANADK